jgi:hypothetical protein
MYSTRARKQSVSVTFRGFTPRDHLVLEVRNAAARLEGVDTVHAVIRADGGDHLEVVVQATQGDHHVHCKVRHRDARIALAQAFERLVAAHHLMDVASPAA